MRNVLVAVALSALPVAAYAQAVTSVSGSPGSISQGFEICLGNHDQAIVTAALLAAHGPAPPAGCFTQQQYAVAVQALAMANQPIAIMLRAETAAQTAAEVAAKEAGLAQERQAQAEAKQRAQLALPAPAKPGVHP